MARLKKGMVIGLTGGIASGKSSVAKILKDMGIFVIDADEVARQVVEPGKPAWREIVDYFGPAVLHEDGSVNRAKLAKIIFGEPQARQRLNQITHPQIRSVITKQMEEAMLSHDLVVLEIPLLIEGGIAYPVDEIWVVCTEESNQVQRLQKRNGLTETEAMERIHAQMPLQEKVALADRVIHNNGTAVELERQVRSLICSLQKKLKNCKGDPGADKGEIGCGKH
jgi:dephospho-CoA kinase